MRRPPSLIGRAIGGAFFAEGWELRITAWCLDDDLDAGTDADFEDVAGLKIVRAFVRERETHADGGRQVTPLTGGREVWVVAHQHDHRGATWYDAYEEVVWLLAYRRHRSGSPDDFFPYCKELDAGDDLLPTAQDYERLIRERDRRFVEAVAVEAPSILRQAREQPGEEVRHDLGGEITTGIAVEVADDLQAITVAFRLDAIDWDSVEVVLAAFHPSPAWEGTNRMPSRDLEEGEVAMTVLFDA